MRLVSLVPGPKREGDKKNVHGVDDTRNPTQDGQTDVDEEVSATATLEEDTQRRQDDGEDDLADVTVGYQVSFSCPIHLSVWGKRERAGQQSSQLTKQ